MPAVFNVSRPSPTLPVIFFLPTKMSRTYLLNKSNEISEFIERAKKCDDEKTAELLRQATRYGKEVDMDGLMRLVSHYNATRAGGAASEGRVDIGGLLDSTRIQRRLTPPQLRVGNLSELEQIRCRAEERKYQQVLRKVPYFKSNRFQTNRQQQRYGRPRGTATGEAGDGDVFADFRTSLAMGTNMLLGLFLSFLTGYWVCHYTGEHSFASKVVAGAICCFFGLVLEVALLILYDYKLANSSSKVVRQTSAAANAATRRPTPPSTSTPRPVEAHDTGPPSVATAPPAAPTTATTRMHCHTVSDVTAAAPTAAGKAHTGGSGGCAAAAALRELGGPGTEESASLPSIGRRKEE